MSAGPPPGPAQSSPPAPTPASEPAGLPPVVRRKGDRGRIYIVAAVVVVAAIIVGVGAGTSWYGLKTSSSSTAACPTGVTLQGNGAAFPASLVSGVWVPGYGKASGNTVNYPGAGAVTGINDLAERTVDFAITDEGVTAAEATAFATNLSTVLTLPVTGGAVVMAYNASLLNAPQTINLTGQELAGVYLGTITTWAGLDGNNPGLAKVTTGLTGVYRSQGAGMSYVLTNYMTDTDKAWATGTGLGTSTLPAWPKLSTTTGASGNSAMLTDLRKDAGAIGYTDLYDALEDGLTVAAIVNSAGNAITPTEANTATAIADTYSVIGSSLPALTNASAWGDVSWVNATGSHDYPMATLSYLMVPLDPAKGHTASATDATALRQWIQYIVTTGQSYNTTQFPFVSPPKPLLTDDLNALSGMNFNGVVLPACS